jgi:hypothetical protein
MLFPEQWQQARWHIFNTASILRQMWLGVSNRSPVQGLFGYRFVAQGQGCTHQSLHGNLVQMDVTRYNGLDRSM